MAEATDVEYKVAVETARPKSWLKTVSAFANTAGGTILFGVNDDTHTPVGLENPQGDVEIIGRRDRMDPLPRFRIDTSEEMGSPWLRSTERTNSEASKRDSIVPVSSQAYPRPSVTTSSVPSSRYIWLSVVISSSPRSEGSTCFAKSTTRLS